MSEEKVDKDTQPASVAPFQPFNLISPLPSEFDVTPEDSISQVSDRRGSTTVSIASVSTKKRTQAVLKAAQAKLQAQQLAEQVRRENELLDEEIKKEIDLEIKRKELELWRIKKEREREVIKALNEAEFAELEKNIITQTEVSQQRSQVGSRLQFTPYVTHIDSGKKTSETEHTLSPNSCLTLPKDANVDVKPPNGAKSSENIDQSKSTCVKSTTKTPSSDAVNDSVKDKQTNLSSTKAKSELHTPSDYENGIKGDNTTKPQEPQPGRSENSASLPKHTPMPYYAQSTPIHRSLPAFSSQMPSAQSSISHVYPSSEPVDAFIDKLVEGQETIIESSYGGPLDPSFAILRAQEQQRLPSIQMHKLTGKPIEWPQFIQTFRDQVHCKSTLTDSDRMSYLYQHLEGEARKSIESIGVSGQNYPSALKTLKRLFGNPHRVTAAHLRKLNDCPAVPPGDRAALRDYHYRVKACASWCSKVGQAAVLQNPEYLSKAAMKLPGNLRYRWYESIQDRYDSITLNDFEQWLQRKVEALFNPFEDFIHEQGKHTRSRQHPKPVCTFTPQKTSLHPFNTTTEISEPETCEDGGAVNVNASSWKNPQVSKNEKCILCPASHRLAYCDNYKTKPLKERKQFVIDQRLCFNCLKHGHGVGNCPSEKRCLKSGCGQKHHTLLHEDAPLKKAEQQSTQSTDGRVTSNQVNTQRDGQVALQIIPVKVRAKGIVVETCALLDAGSDATLIRKDLAEQLHLDGEFRRVELNTVESDATMTNLKCVSFEIMSAAHADPVMIEGAWIVNKMNVPVLKYDQKAVSKQWKHLQGVTLPDLQESKAKLLIGANMPHLLVHLEVKQGEPGQPIAVRTALGWSLFGSISNNPSNQICSNKIVLKDCNTLHNELEKFWQIDSYGTTSTNQQDSLGFSKEDERAMEILERTTTKIDGHYATGLLWKKDNMVLPNNRTLALSRLHSTERKLKKQPELAKKYQEVLDEYLKNGHCKKLSQEEATSLTARTWYLPHHAVVNPNKPGKLRIVFDAAAKYNNVALNDCLLVGPDLLNSLVGILMRFRTGKIGIMADVEKMFHQVRVIEQDTDSLRFLWRELDTAQPPQEYAMQVHVFGATDSPCCATYALRKTAEDHPNDFSEEALHCVKRNFYVDDVLASKSTPSEAATLATELTNLLATGNFRLTKWASNCRQVLRSMPKLELAPSVVNIDCDELPRERALGVTWSLEKDTFSLNSLKGAFVDTKRGILSAISSIFDPLGLANPYVVKAKLVLQEVWRRQIDWDDVLPEDILQSWSTWMDGLEHSAIIEIPRWYGFHQHKVKILELHVFCDASEVAYGAVAYLRAVTDNNVKVSFLLSKSRLAPIKAATIPRLELQAAVVAVRLKCMIIAELDLVFHKIYFWSDSMIVLQYLNNTNKRFTTYVSHRITEILTNSSVEQWHHVPGKLNVADDCTRGLEMQNLRQDHRWFNGPHFLYLTEDMWPSDPLTHVDETELEVKASVLSMSTTTTRLVKWSDYSTLGRLLHVYGWISRFLYNLRCCLRKDQAKTVRTLKSLSVDDLKDAMNCLCYMAQSESFPNEYSSLKANQAIQQDSRILSLQPLMENKLIRVGGRLQQAPLPYESKHQIILLSTHPLARLIVKDIHETNSHVGREHTLSLLRERFWILHGKGLVRKVLKECLYCARRRAKPRIPVMAQLPKSRFAMCEGPFTNTGVDYFGPISVKRGRSTEKRWGCLFTCLSTRAVHLELSGDLSSDAFIMCLRRFVARRGKPTMMLSDNGTNFVGANRELKEALDELENSDIVSRLAKQGITWQFNPPAAPHMGGVFESLVKQVKRVMKATLTTRVFGEDTLHTVLTETEAILNSRPLTANSDDPEDYEALTPNHFLIGRASSVSSPGQFHEREVDSRTRWRAVQAVSDMIWQRWLKEYLPTLTTRSKWNKDRPNLKQGDLVIVVSSDIPRAEWPLARVMKVYEGKDRRVRSAEVKVPNGTLLRPVSKLCLLEGAV